MNGYAVKRLSGVIHCIQLTEEDAKNAQMFLSFATEIVPVTITEGGGEPVMGVVERNSAFSSVKLTADGLALPDGAKLYAHPSDALALLLDIRKELQSIEDRSSRNGMLWQREYIKRIGALLKG